MANTNLEPISGSRIRLPEKVQVNVRIKKMRIAVTTCFLVFLYSITIASTNQVVVVDTQHNTVNTDRKGTPYSLQPCQRFSIDASEFPFTKPLEDIVIDVRTNGHRVAYFVTNVSSNTTRLFHIDSSSFITTNTTTLTNFPSGSHISIYLLYKKTGDPNADFLLRPVILSEWTGIVKIE